MVSYIFFIFTPKFGEDEPNLTSIFFKWGWIKPPTSYANNAIYRAELNPHPKTIVGWGPPWRTPFPINLEALKGGDLAGDMGWLDRVKGQNSWSEFLGLKVADVANRWTLVWFFGGTNFDPPLCGEMRCGFFGVDFLWTLSLELFCKRSWRDRRWGSV